MHERSGRHAFISYSSRDRERVFEIADRLQRAGIPLWLDRHAIEGGTQWSDEIVRGIRSCAAIIIMCSDAALRSRNVKQEIQLGWRYERPYIPVLLEQTSFQGQLEYFLEGWQWIDAAHQSDQHWLPAMVRALAQMEVIQSGTAAAPGNSGQPAPATTDSGSGFSSLRALARLTDEIWPMSAAAARREGYPTVRGLGAPQDHLQRRFSLGSRMCLAFETDRPGNLLLLDQGPEGIIYCLCPSWFAPETRLSAGRTYLPQPAARYDSFVLTGVPGREHILAIMSEDPLGADWLPQDRKIPSRVLSPDDIDRLLDKIKSLPAESWIAHATYFDVVRAE
jgi:hypothetical protein